MSVINHMLIMFSPCPECPKGCLVVENSPTKVGYHHCKRDKEQIAGDTLEVGHYGFWKRGHLFFGKIIVNLKYNLNLVYLI